MIVGAVDAAVSGTRQEQADESFDGESSQPGTAPDAIVWGFAVKNSQKRVP